MFFNQAEDGIGDGLVTGVQTCAFPSWSHGGGYDAVVTQLSWTVARRHGVGFDAAEKSVAWTAARSHRVGFDAVVTPVSCTATRIYGVGFDAA